jgi:hypothetical protein
MLEFIVFVIAVVAFAFALKAMNQVAALRTRLDALESANAVRPASAPPLAPRPEPTPATSPAAMAMPPP